MASATSTLRSLEIASQLQSRNISPTTYSKFFIHDTNEIYHSRLVASAAIIRKGRVLLIQRASDSFLRLLWELPGGRCEARDESVIDSAARELREETGLAASQVVDLVNEYEWLDCGQPWKKITFLMAVEDESEAGSQLAVKLDPNEHEKFAWATEEDVRMDRCGGVALSWTSDDQKQTVLKAFGVWGRAVG